MYIGRQIGKKSPHEQVGVFDSEQVSSPTNRTIVKIRIPSARLSIPMRSPYIGWAPHTTARELSHSLDIAMACMLEKLP